MKTIDGGMFIVIESGEGSGKTTVREFIANKLKELDYDVVVAIEPGGNPACQSIRNIVVNNFTELGPIPQLFLYSASRYVNCRDTIIPALKRGAIVVCDRFVTSTIIYQGILGKINMRDITEVNRMATLGCKPDLEILLDVDPEVGLSRTKLREENNEIDKLDFDFHKSVNHLYKYHSYANRRVIIDANKDADTVCESAWKTLCNFLPDR